jgi:hypothetical protein
MIRGEQRERAPHAPVRFCRPSETNLRLRVHWCTRQQLPGIPILTLACSRGSNRPTECLLQVSLADLNLLAPAHIQLIKTKWDAA